MKIGILTQPLHNNYGGVLQAYALQQVLIRMGHHPITLSRKYDVQISLLQYVFKIVSFFKCLYRIYIQHSDKWIVENPFARNYEPLKNHNRNFIDTHISCSEELYSSEELLNYVQSQGIGGIIVGSDQVWRQTYSPCITDYFLCFLPQSATLKCVAYAASFGGGQTDITPDKLADCKQGIKRFDAISVREKSAVDIVKEQFNRTATHVLDPTMLLSACDYDKLIAEEGIENKPSGVVSYILDPTDDKTQILNTVREQFAPKTTLHTDLKILSPNENSGQSIVPTIGKWLQSIRDAEFVVTDSFHGCVFSIIFRKPFVIIGNKRRGIDRFESLLSELGLKQRIVLSFPEFKQDMGELFMPIDYSAVYSKYMACKNESIAWLETNLQCQTNSPICQLFQ